MASTVLGGYGEAMRQLVDYPYGCLEQMSSRLVPFVALRELHGVFKLLLEAGHRAPGCGTGRDRPLGDERSRRGGGEDGQGYRGAPARRRRLRVLSSDSCSSAARIRLRGPRARARRRGRLPGGPTPAGASTSGEGRRGERADLLVVEARRGPRNPGLRAVRPGPTRAPQASSATALFARRSEPRLTARRCSPTPSDVAEETGPRHARSPPSS